MSQFYLVLFLVTAGVNAAAQLLLKRGSQDVPALLAGQENFLLKIVKIFFNPFVFSAAALLAAGMLLWLKLISKVELSRAYPINIALTVLITSGAAILLFNEGLGWSKLFGVALLIAGLFFIFNG